METVKESSSAHDVVLPHENEKQGRNLELTDHTRITGEEIMKLINDSDKNEAHILASAVPTKITSAQMALMNKRRKNLRKKRQS